MPCCVAFGCTNKTDKKKDKSITFHRFPKNEDVRRQWISVIKRYNWKPSNNSVVCSEHFEEDCFDRTSPFRVYLKEGASPTIFPKLPPHLQPVKKEKRRVLKRLQPQAFAIELPIPVKKQLSDKEMLEKVKTRLSDTCAKLKNEQKKNTRLKKRVTLLSDIIKELTSRRAKPGFIAQQQKTLLKCQTYLSLLQYEEPAGNYPLLK